MIRLENVTKYYNSGDVVALGLRKISVSFEIGEFVAITGESGSGKSTLLNVLSGLDSFEEGEFYLNDEETSYYIDEDWESYRKSYVGFVFQNYNIIDSFSVLDNVMAALMIQGYDEKNRKKRALELIEQVGLSSHVHHKASKLSGGQKQRAVIARALAKDCPIIICDEPTGNLDKMASRSILELLYSISKEKLVIVVTHDYEEIEEFASRKIHLFDGEIIEDKLINSNKSSEVIVLDNKNHMSPLDLFKLSLKNLLTTPRRTLFTFFVIFFGVFVFTFSYGNFLKDINTLPDYTETFFTNVSESRITVNKYDQTKFTQEELDSIYEIDGVVDVVEYDQLMDLIILNYIPSFDRYVEVEYYISPANMLLDKEIIEGEYPNSYNEIVVESDSNFNIGDEITLGFERVGGYSASQFDEYGDYNVFQVVGVINQRMQSAEKDTIYFSDDFFYDEKTLVEAFYLPRTLSNKTKMYFEIDQDNKLYINGVTFAVDDELEDGEIKMSFEYLLSFSRAFAMDYIENPDFYTDLDSVNMHFESVYEEYDIEFTVVGEYMINEEETSNTIAMNRETYNQLITGNYYQLSVLVYDSFDAKTVIKEIEELDFNTLYPAGVSDPYSRVVRLVRNLLFGVTLAILTVAIYFITYIVLKNIQASKKKDYLILRSIGAMKKDLNRINIIEFVLVIFASYIVVIGLVLLNSFYGFGLPDYSRYFGILSYIFIFVVNILMAYLISNRFNKKMFSSSVITSLKSEVE